MTANRVVLNSLLASGEIHFQPGALLNRTPCQGAVDFDRVEGMLLGLAIGDALGNTTESMLPHERIAKHGEIRDYLPNQHANNQAKGLPSDDTQLAFWTLEQLIADRGLVPEHLAERICRERIFGIGSTVREFIANFKSGKPWYRCGPRSAGNGALMRIAPVLVPHLVTATPDLWVDSAVAAALTHNDSASISACLAFVSIFWELMHMDQPPAAEWWGKVYVATAADPAGVEPDSEPEPPSTGAVRAPAESQLSQSRARCGSQATGGVANPRAAGKGSAERRREISSSMPSPSRSIPSALRPRASL